jgi:hypothetical protein
MIEDRGDNWMSRSYVFENDPSAKPLPILGTSVLTE